MNKQLLAVEFRYQDKPDDIGSTCHEKTITIGIYDTIKEAVEEGNKVIKIISKYFEVRSDDKFEVHGLFGFPHRLFRMLSKILIVALALFAAASAVSYFA